MPRKNRWYRATKQQHSKARKRQRHWHRTTKEDKLYLDAIAKLK